MAWLRAPQVAMATGLATYLQNDGDLSQVAFGATLHQWDVRGQAHAVDMITSPW